MVQGGVVFKGVEAPTHHMDAVLVGHATHMVARTWQGFAAAPVVGLRIIDLVPTHTGALFGGGGSTADQMHLAVQGHGGSGAARAGHGRNG